MVWVFWGVLGFFPQVPSDLIPNQVTQIATNVKLPLNTKDFCIFCHDAFEAALEARSPSGVRKAYFIFSATEPTGLLTPPGRSIPPVPPCWSAVTARVGNADPEPQPGGTARASRLHPKAPSPARRVCRIPLSSRPGQPGKVNDGAFFPKYLHLAEGFDEDPLLDNDIGYKRRLAKERARRSATA